METNYFNQQQRRNANFIKLPNHLKAKVGSGGLDKKTLDKAQKFIEDGGDNFVPLADKYIKNMMEGIVYAQKNINSKDVNAEELISGILYPCIQLKANGGMFNYSLVTQISDRFIQFLEVIETMDSDVLDIAISFHNSIKIIIHDNLKMELEKFGEELMEELNNACMRYFEKNKMDTPKH